MVPGPNESLKESLWGTVFEGDAFINSAELRIRELITYIRSNEG